MDEIYKPIPQAVRRGGVRGKWVKKTGALLGKGGDTGFDAYAQMG